jgi:hypothetical protein
MPGGAARSGTSLRMQASATSGVDRLAKAFRGASFGKSYADSKAIVLNDRAAPSSLWLCLHYDFDPWYRLGSSDRRGPLVGS